jgi:hypothetical protein
MAQISGVGGGRGGAHISVHLGGPYTLNARNIHMAICTAEGVPVYSIRRSGLSLLWARCVLPLPM